MTHRAYVGSELELFAQAGNWKSYWSACVHPLPEGEVLEVGAGMGANIPLFAASATRWVCLEPDVQLASQLRRRLAATDALSCEVVCGTVGDLPAGRKFAAILYIDVLEHIEDDGHEMLRACAHLVDGGKLIVLAPAHPWLYSRFDAAIGHFRRYTRRTLAAVVPAELVVERLIYLDSVGVLASLANRLLLRHDIPTLGQIRAWDEWMIPVSRVVDAAFGYRFGKSVLGVWRRKPARAEGVEGAPDGGGACAHG